jgi:pimeloyl-ACP methyl ester carboxylesterase
VASFALIHGAWHDGWCWHLLDEELRQRGHTVVSPDLPCDDLTATWDVYAETVTAALPADEPPVVVGHSLGAMTAALVASIVPVRLVIYLAPSTPTNRTFEDMPPPFHTGREMGAVEDGRGDHWPDPNLAVRDLYPRLDPELAHAAAARLRYQAYPPAFPLEGPPTVPSAYVLATDDEIYTVESRRWAATHLFGLDPIELAGGHFPMLEQPVTLADLLCDLVAATEPKTAN